MGPREEGGTLFATSGHVLAEKRSTRSRQRRLIPTDFDGEVGPERSLDVPETFGSHRKSFIFNVVLLRQAKRIKKRDLT